MRRFYSLLIAMVLSFCFIVPTAFANEQFSGSNSKVIESVELRKVNYYAAVKTADDIRTAATYVDFIAYFDDGTSAEYDSNDGWSDESVTSEVSWYIQPETDELYGEQQSLYVTIDGTDYWAGYVNVEVNKWKAIGQILVMWDSLTPEQKTTVVLATGITGFMFTAVNFIISTTFFAVIAMIIGNIILAVAK